MKEIRLKVNVNNLYMHRDPHDIEISISPDELVKQLKEQGVYNTNLLKFQSEPSPTIECEHCKGTGRIITKENSKSQLGTMDCPYCKPSTKIEEFDLEVNLERIGREESLSYDIKLVLFDLTKAIKFLMKG
ncbi:MAG: hypothetical protein FJ241_10650 [Nitrospira sp.]|nr:hypothetical protein [Nitrospira sp.]